VRDFEPVFLPIEKAPVDRYSATFGRAFNVCPRAAYLYADTKGGAATADLQRGSAVHRINELATLAAVEQGEPGVPPPEVVKAIANEVLADPEYHVPVEQHDYIRECAYRWAAETVIDPASLIAVETLFVLDVDGMQIRCKIDRAEILEGGAAALVVDYKSTRNLPAYEDIGRKRPVDGSIAAKDYQLVLYALAVVFGVPVRMEACHDCHGTGVERFDEGLGERCSTCKGRAWREVPEPFSLAERAQRVDLSFVYPGIEEKSTGLMAHRDLSLTILELHEYLDSLRAQVAQVRSSVETGSWPAVYGVDHCKECPAPDRCPIPKELRKHAGTINTRAEAEEAAEQLAVEKLQHAARRKELVAWVKSQPLGERALFYGRNAVIEVGYQEAVEITDREGMFEAIDRAVQFGEVFDRSRFERVKKSTPIKDRKLSEAELEERWLNNNNGEVDGDGSDGTGDAGAAGAADGSAGG
jgi:hypothetical protein